VYREAAAAVNGCTRCEQSRNERIAAAAALVYRCTKFEQSRNECMARAAVVYRCTKSEEVDGGGGSGVQVH
jgi:hypothetical protein